jgi:hypothetical protein
LARRRKFYKSCGYQVTIWDQGVEPKKKEESDEEKAPAPLDFLADE